jgi:hypothetical protein
MHEQSERVIHVLTTDRRFALAPTHSRWRRRRRMRLFSAIWDVATSAGDNPAEQG